MTPTKTKKKGRSATEEPSETPIQLEPPEPIEIVEFGEEDAPELAELFAAVWPHAEEYPPAWRRKRCLTPQQIVEEMRMGYHYFGARIEGRIAGVYKALLTLKGCMGEHQTVHPDFRRRGLVRAMYHQFIEFARRHGAPCNYCNILVSQHRMRRLVEALGFRPQGPPYEQAPGMLVQLYLRPTSQPKFPAETRSEEQKSGETSGEKESPT